MTDCGPAVREILREHARSAIGMFTEAVYNRQRLHSALDYQSPVVFEARPG